MRLCYRARQFWQALRSRPSSGAIAGVEAILSPSLMVLFTGMQPSEQTHALKVLEALQAQGETDLDLLAAALLHDVGKQRCPLHILERVAVVLVQAISPVLSRRWGEQAVSDCSGWRKPFIVAAQHAEWGAEMANQAGISPLGAMLIRHHQLPAPTGSERREDILLRKLQAVDDNT